MDASTSSVVAFFRRLTQLATDYILACLNEENVDESFLLDDLSYCYRIPFALIEMGRKELAGRVLQSICRRYMLPNGDFRQTIDLKSADPKLNQFDLSINAWILVAAMHLGRDEVLEQGLLFVEQHWMEDWEVYVSSFRSKSPYIDFFSLSDVAILLLSLNYNDEKLDIVEKVLLDFLVQQPANRFYLHMNASTRQLIADDSLELFRHGCHEFRHLITPALVFFVNLYLSRQRPETLEAIRQLQSLWKGVGIRSADDGCMPNPLPLVFSIMVTNELDRHTAHHAYWICDIRRLVTSYAQKSLGLLDPEVKTGDRCVRALDILIYANPTTEMLRELEGRRRL